MEKKYVYMVQTRWNMDTDCGVDNLIFSKYKDALESFFNIIKDEKEYTWANDYLENDKFNDEIDFYSINYDESDDKEVYRKWYIQQKYDWCYYTEVTLDIMELHE